MRKFIILALLSPMLIFSQVSKDYAVLVTASVEENPTKITLNWPLENATSYYIYKKLKSDATYGSALATLAGTSTSYTDTDVLLGEVYEYYIKRNGPTTAYGYINSGIKVAADENGLGSKGKLILLVDSTHSTSLSMEIDRLIDDLEGEGWTTLRHDVSPNASVPSVRQIIQNEYNLDKDHVKSVFILGHVPVPYSGRLNPDAHGNHIGAWPADAYYGDIDGNWTDFSVNDTSASDPRNRNVPGDGKFDQSLIPSPVELQVGRVDLSNMPSFSSSETELLRNYLNKNHAYRTKAFDVVPRALIDDNFGGFNGEAFAASGWKAFSTFFGPDSIKTSVGSNIDYRTDLNKDSYLWSYGCGAGSYSSCSGIGNTTQLAGDSLQSVFTMLFGSYFGDWDNKNNILRAPLAQGLTLTNVWSGRPHWYFHHMGMGENIGYSQHLMVNQNPYYQHYAARFVHIALMGDPTLKMFIVAPPSDLLLTENNNMVELSWTASSDNVLGYHIYRKDTKEDIYKRVNENIISGTSYIDTDFEKPSTYGYSVRAVKLEVTSSGSYYNLSTGTIGEIETIYTGMHSKESDFAFNIYPNPSKGVFTLFTNDYPPGQYTLSIYSSMNKLVKQSTISLERNQQLQFDYSDLPGGFYILSVGANSQVHAEKLIIAK